MDIENHLADIDTLFFNYDPAKLNAVFERIVDLARMDDNWVSCPAA